ncbi:MAG: hypothetical protein GC201_10100 [Alphaproteobacteria bacterium]|nr:hypothetical protein [Alphaproteobacteria bacterium]
MSRFFVYAALLTASVAAAPAANAKEISCTRKVDWTTLISPADATKEAGMPSDATIVIRAQSLSIKWEALNVDGKTNKAVTDKMTVMKEVPIDYSGSGKDNVVNIRFKYTPSASATQANGVEFGESFYVTGRKGKVATDPLDVKIKRPSPHASWAWAEGTTCTGMIDTDKHQVRFDFVLP